MISSRCSKDKPIFTLVETDLQAVARQRLGRDLTAGELQAAGRIFANAIDWWEYAECAIDEAIEEHM
jgi:hypothetical protein